MRKQEIFVYDSNLDDDVRLEVNLLTKQDVINMVGNDVEEWKLDLQIPRLLSYKEILLDEDEMYFVCEEYFGQNTIVLYIE